MRRIVVALALWSGAVSPLVAQKKPTPTGTPFSSTGDLVAAQLSGDRALKTVAFVERFFRLPGNRGFDASIDTVGKLLAKAGFVLEERAKPTDRLVYRIESRPMTAPAWSPEDASLQIVGQSKPLEQWATNHNMLAINSWSTPAGGVDADVVDVGAGAEADFDKVDVKGKIVTGDAAANQLYGRAMKRGALGVLAPQKLPAYNQQAKNTTAIQFSSVSRDTVNKGFAIFLSAAARDALKRELAKGPVKAHVSVTAYSEVRPERTVVAEIRGSEAPTERFVYSAHVQEPGANDNASGVGLLAEMARVAALLVREGKYDPARTMTFLWGNEISSTARFIREDSVRRQGIKWGMSLDMVGENTALTGGTFLIEKMKDPSAVWVRGEDQHTEWGGSPVDAKDVWPYWLNDFAKQRCLDRAKKTGWVVKANPYEGGSDHTPFLQAKIPAVLFWHFTDQYYHTDRDRIEMVSPATLANVGNCALTTGLLLAGGEARVATAVIEETADVAIHRIAAEATLSREAIAKGGDAAKEATILEAWRDYYVAALAKVPEIAVKAGNFATDIADAQERVRKAAADGVASLKK